MGKIIRGNFQKKKQDDYPTYSSLRRQVERDIVIIVCTIISIFLITLAFLVIWIGLS